MSEEIEQLKMLSAQQPELQMLQGALESLSDPIVIVDTAYHIRYVNEQAEFVFGYNRKELVGQHINILIPDALKEVHLGHLEEFKNHPHARAMKGGVELSARRKDTTAIRCRVQIAPIVTEFDRYVSAQIRVL